MAEPPRRKRGRTGEPRRKTIAEVMRTSFRSYRLSPLYGFADDDEALARYGRSLVKAIELRGLALSEAAAAVGEPAKGAVVTVSLEALASGHDEAIGSSLRIVAERVDEEAVVEGLPPPLSAVLVALTPNNAAEDDGFWSFPLLLVKAGPAWVGCLQEWLERQFGCHCSPIAIPPHELAGFVAAFAATTTRPLSLLYELPTVSKGIRTIALNVPSADVRHLSHALPENTTLLEAVQSRFFDKFRIELGAATLVRVGSGTVLVATDGHAKFFDPERFHEAAQRIAAAGAAVEADATS